MELEHLQTLAKAAKHIDEQAKSLSNIASELHNTLAACARLEEERRQRLQATASIDTAQKALDIMFNQE